MWFILVWFIFCCFWFCLGILTKTDLQMFERISLVLYILFRISLVLYIWFRISLVLYIWFMISLLLYIWFMISLISSMSSSMSTLHISAWIFSRPGALPCSIFYLTFQNGWTVLHFIYIWFIHSFIINIQCTLSINKIFLFCLLEYFCSFFKTKR